MTLPNWLLVALQGLTTFAVTAALYAWLDRSRRAASLRGSGVLQYPRSMLALGLGAAVFFTFLTWISMGSKTGGPMIASGFALFAALGAYLVVDSVLAAFYIQTDGIRYRVPFQSGMVRWQEIEKVGWSQSCQWFVLRTARGRKVRISSMLRGLPELAGALLEHLTPGQFSDEAYRLMRDAAAGIPPRLPD